MSTRICQQCKGEKYCYDRPKSAQPSGCKQNSNIPLELCHVCEMCEGKGVVTQEMRDSWYKQATIVGASEQ